MSQRDLEAAQQAFDTATARLESGQSDEATAKEELDAPEALVGQRCGGRGRSAASAGRFNDGAVRCQHAHRRTRASAVKRASGQSGPRTRGSDFQRRSCQPARSERGAERLGNRANGADQSAPDRSKSPKRLCSVKSNFSGKKSPIAAKSVRRWPIFKPRNRSSNKRGRP